MNVMYDMTNVPIDVLLDELAKRKGAQLRQEHADNEIVRQVIIAALRNPHTELTMRRVLERQPNKNSDIALFYGNGSHLYDISITLTCSKEVVWTPSNRPSTIP